MDLGLKGKYALVTGGSRGIGLAIALSLADEGCNVAICGRNLDALTDALFKLDERGGNNMMFPIDVTKGSDITFAVNEIQTWWPRLHILINNVGGGGRWGLESFENTPTKIWRAVYNKNAIAAMRFTKAVVPNMRKQKWGRVITISSIYGKEVGGRPWFNVAKSAEIALMKSLSKRKEYVRNGITFNTVCPGHISVKGKPDETNLEEFPLGRMGRPEEVANVVTFLCSKKASLVNGACITIDGGESFSF